MQIQNHWVCWISCIKNTVLMSRKMLDKNKYCQNHQYLFIPVTGILNLQNSVQENFQCNLFKPNEK